MQGELLQLTLAPRVPMPYFQAAGYLAALSLADCAGEDARVLWPMDVIGSDGTPLAHVAVRGGYGDDGAFVELTVAFQDDRIDLADAEQAIRARADAWERAVGEGKAAAGPLAPFAGAYFDRMAGMGQTVELLFPNGNVYCRAELEGIDVWGRICVELDDGRDTEYSPEQVGMRLP